MLPEFGDLRSKFNKSSSDEQNSGKFILDLVD